MEHNRAGTAWLNVLNSWEGMPMNWTIWALYSGNMDERGSPAQSRAAAGEPTQKRINVHQAAVRIPQRQAAARNASSSPRKVHAASSQGAAAGGNKEEARAGGSQWPR